MEKYHIYEEIGKGSFSQIFKGREKKKIEYVAIKRIEKSAMNKTVSEVQVMHKLSHPHMLKFYDWYETRNNLWLILEYCTGGDLESILKQDGHLPETSVRIFGIDMVAGLRYLHGCGILFGDLRPRNVLVDEYGILKLADFKFAQKVPKEALGDTPIASRGHAPCMAPELFTAAGVHSFSSDFWALGCTLFELRRGYLPFGDASPPSSLEDLMGRIRSLDPLGDNNPNPNPRGSDNNPSPNLSPELADLLGYLLEKAPMNRCGWPALCAHPFWAPSNPSAPAAADLPAQPVYEGLVRDLEAARSQQLMQSSAAEMSSMPLSPNSVIPVVTSVSRPLVQAAVDSTPHKLPMPAYGATPLRETPSKSSAVSSAAAGSHHSHHSHHQVAVTPARMGLSTVDEVATPLLTGITGIRTQQEDSSPRSRAPTPIAQGQQGQGQGVLTGIVPQLTAAALLVHASELAVKPIVGNKLIELIDGYEYSASALPFEVLQEGAAPEGHLGIVYKAIGRTATITMAAGATAATPQVVAALTERIAILKYLCNVCTSSEVSNLLLNTSFLSLVLRLLRHQITYAPAARGASAANAASNAQALLTASRYWCATLLALLLRYATSISPPAAGKRDDHIIGTLVSLLKDSSSGGSGGSSSKPMDSKLKKRLVAALGEMVFYISAQEDEGDQQEERWALPSTAIDILGRCLREDNDDVIKHYAAKTIENVLAQGGLAYKYRFISMDMASRLLEMTMHSLCDALQATAATALSHTLHLLLTAHTSEEVQAVLKAMSSSSSSKRPPSSPSVVDPFAAPVALSAAKFIAKLFASANLPAIMELLKDGQPKVQQSLLNVINMVLAPTVQVEAALETSIRSLLGPLRAFFLRSAHGLLVPVLFRLLEQGSLTIIRSKALLCMQLLSVHMPVLINSLADRRLPVLLMRLLEPALSSAGADAKAATHLVKCALSLALHWKEVLEGSVRELAVHLEEIARLSPDLLQAHSPMKKGSLSPVPNGQRSPAPRPMERLSFTASQLRQVSELLRSAIALVAAQPSLCRIVLGGHAAFIQQLAKALRALPVARDTVQAVQSNDMNESVAIAEQACLASAEGIAMIDIPDPSERYMGDGGWPWALDWQQFISVSALQLLPSLTRLLAHPLGDIRTVVAACFRKLVPGLIRGASAGDAVGLAEVLRAYAAAMPSLLPLLADQPPIPQYVTRLLVDSMAVDRQIGAQVVPMLSGAAHALVHRLGAQQAEDEDEALDPQLVVLLRVIFDHPEGASMLLQADLGSALQTAFAHALQAAGIGRYPFPSASAPTDLLGGLLEAMAQVLQHVLRQVSEGVRGQGQGQGDQLRRFVRPLCACCPALLLLLAYVSHALQAAAGPGSGSTEEEQLLGMAEQASRCVGVLFDLFPDALTAQLLSRQSVASSADAGAPLTARMVMAQLLMVKAPEGDKVRSKFLKILLGVVKMAPSFGAAAKAKECIRTEPLSSALLACVSRGRGDSAGAQLANKVIEAAAADDGIGY